MPAALFEIPSIDFDRRDHAKGKPVMLTRTGLLAAILLGISLCAVADAQQLGSERIARGRPILRVRSDFPNALIWHLRFAVDNKDGSLWLYSAGEDKVVRRWFVTDNNRGNFGLQPRGVVKWPIYRGVRGRIYAMDVFSLPRGGHRVAIGGAGVKSSLVYLVDVDEPENAQSLIDTDNAFRKVIYSVGFSEDGAYLFVGEDGQDDKPHAEIAVWNVALGQPAPTLDRRIKTNLRKVRHLAVGLESIAAAGPVVGKSAYAIEVWNIAGVLKPTPPTLLRKGLPHTIRGLAWKDAQTWAAGTLLGVVEGNRNGANELAGFANQDKVDSFGKGVTLVKSGGGKGAFAFNHASFPATFDYAAFKYDKSTKQFQLVNSWSPSQRLEPGRKIARPDADYLGIRLYHRGKPEQESFNILMSGQHNVQFYNKISGSHEKYLDDLEFKRMYEAGMLQEFSVGIAEDL
ncbi:MAG: hypothetical protein IH897_11185, partial [Planctomycetes bacterium]|nr:hypothetical protein [Planctomycetota bacterium]